MIVQVYDANGAKLLSTIESYHVAIESIDICDTNITWLVSVSYALLSTNEQYLYLFQSLQSILEHMNEIGNSEANLDKNCFENMFEDVMSVIHRHFGSEQLCQTYYVIVKCIYE